MTKSKKKNNKLSRQEALSQHLIEETKKLKEQLRREKKERFKLKDKIKRLEKEARRDGQLKEAVQKKSTETRTRDDRSSSVEIVREIPKTQKPREDPKIRSLQKADSSAPKCDFVPVTEESIVHVLKLIKTFVKENRTVAIVFDSCFLVDNISMAIIRKKFESIFGKISSKQVLIRYNAKELAKNLDEAYANGVTSLNHAYIVGEKGLTEKELNRRAAARDIFCCPMTLGCVINNLKRGIFLMHKNVVFGVEDLASKGPVKSIRSPDREPNTKAHKDKQSPGSDSSNSSNSSKNTRMAASLRADCDMNGSTVSNGISAKGEIDSKLWDRISKMGNSVIKIENLPGKLTVNGLNLMMGTSSLQADQIIAADQPIKDGQRLIQVRIVLNKTNPDMLRILTKNLCKTPFNQTLNIEQTHHYDLRKFMIANAKNLRMLPSGNILQINRIGYGKRV